MSNVYYHPEKWDLEEVTGFSYNDEAYQFDLRKVWRDPKTLALYTARDSGCSCPIPFENLSSRQELDRIGLENYMQYILEAVEHGCDLVEVRNFQAQLTAAVADYSLKCMEKFSNEDVQTKDVSGENG